MTNRLRAALYWALGIKPPSRVVARVRGYLPAREPGATGHRPGASWAADVAVGPLTRFGTNGREHTCAPVCEPSHPSHRSCFTQQAYVPRKGD